MAFLQAFLKQMREPFYEDYVHDALAQAATSAGFRVKCTVRAWLAKVVTASTSQSI